MARIELDIVALGDFKSVTSQIKALQAQVETLNKSVAGVGLGGALSKDLNAAQAAFNSTMLSTGQFTATTVKMTAETAKFGAALESGKLKLSQYFGIITKQSGAAAASMQALALEQLKLQQSIVMSDPTKKGMFTVYTPTRINEVASATKLATMQQNLYNLALEKSSLALVNWGKNTQWAGRQLTVGLTIPMVMFGSTAVKTFTEVNNELVRLQKVYGTGLTQPTKQVLDSIKGQVTALATELAGSLGIAAKDTAAMAADLAATGKTGNDLITATREAMRLQKLGELDTQSAMATTISLQNVYKLNTEQLSGAVNFLNAVENQTSTSLQDLAAGIPKVGPIVQQLGGSFKDTAVMMVAMKEAGVPAAQSANAIKSAIASLINPTVGAQKAFAAYHISLKDIATSTGGNPVKMIESLQSALKGLAPLAQAQLIEKLFGKFQEARIQALITNLGAVNSQTKTAFDLANATESQLASIAKGELSTAAESVTGKWKRAVESFKANLLPVGEMFTKIGTMILTFANKIGDAFGKLPSPIKTVLGIFAGGAALAGPIIMLTGLLANFAGYLLKTIANIRLIAAGGKSFKELLTPEIIASQNAAKMFGSEISNEVNAVDLLAQAIDKLTVSLEAMSKAMIVDTQDMSISAAAQIATAKTSVAAQAALQSNGIYHIMAKEEYGAFNYKGQAEMAQSKPTSGVYALRDEKLNALMAKGGVESERFIAAMTALTGETEDATSMFRTSVTDYLGAITKLTDLEGNSLITQEDANSILAQINTEYMSALQKMQEEGMLLTDINNPLSEIANKLMLQNAMLSRNPAEFARMWSAFNTSSSLTTKLGPGAGGGSRAIPIESPIYGATSIKLAGTGISTFYHAYNEDFLKFREKTIADFRALGVEQGGALEQSLIEQMDKTFVAINEAVASGEVGTASLMEEEAIKVGDAWTEGMVSVISKSKGQISAAMMEEIMAAAIAGIPEAELAGMTFGEAFMAGQSRAMGIVSPSSGRSLPGVMRGRAGGLSGKMGGMGIGMAAMMGGSVLSGKGGIAGSAGSVLSNVGMASMAGMFLPEEVPLAPILAGVAALTAVYEVVKHINEVEKLHKDEAKADWTTSTALADIYGNKIASIADTFNSMKSSVPGFASVVDTTAKDVANFVDTVNKLPKDNPLSLVFRQITDETNPAKIKELVQNYVNLQVAMGALKPEQAQSFIDTLLRATNHAELLNTILPITKTQVDALVLSLQQAKGKTDEFQIAFAQAFSQAASTTSADGLKSIIDAIITGVGNATTAVHMLEVQFKSMGAAGFANLQILQLLTSAHYDPAIIMQLFANAAAGGGVDLYDKNGKLKSDKQALAESNLSTEAGRKAKAQVESSNSSLQTSNKINQKTIDLLNARKTKLEDALKSEQKITAELKRQQDFRISQMDIDNQIRMAQASGDYLKANLLQMQKGANASDFANQGVQNSLQSQIDSLDAEIAKYNQSVQTNQTAISDNTTQLAKLNKDGISASVNINLTAEQLAAELARLGLGGMGKPGTPGYAASTASLPKNATKITDLININKEGMSSGYTPQASDQFKKALPLTGSGNDKANNLVDIWWTGYDDGKLQKDAVKAYAAAQGISSSDTNMGFFALVGNMGKTVYEFKVKDNSGQIIYEGSGNAGEIWDPSVGKFIKKSGLGNPDAKAGQPLIVGDRGRPEVFIPKTDGMIVPSLDQVSFTTPFNVNALKSPTFATPASSQNGQVSGTISTNTYNISVNVNNEDAQGIADTIMDAIKRKEGSTFTNRRVMA